MKNDFSKEVYIGRDYIQPRFTLQTTLVYWMFLDYISAPFWVIAVMSGLIAAMWVLYFYDMRTKTGIGLNAEFFDIENDKET